MDEKRRYAIMGLAILLAFVAYGLPLSLPSSAQTVLAIIVLAFVLWISEAIPLHVTALLAAFLLVTIGGFGPDKVFAQFFDKVVVLVLGGFVLAVALSKHKLDEYLANKLLGRFGSSASMVLLGMLFVSAALSMWMANSAAAAICMPIALVVLSKNKCKAGNSQFGKAMVIAVAYGATIGGIGTLIGSTPNVLAQKFLAENGLSFGFVEWLIRGFPFMIALLLAAWLVLKTVFKSEIKTVELDRHTNPFTQNQKKVAVIFLFTVLLWVTESIHGIHNSVVALIPIILFSVFNLLEPKDFQKIDWGSLILIGGGIALGLGITSSGLADSFSSALGTALANQPYFVVLLGVAIIGILLTSFISNTAASAVLIPIITALSVVLGVNMTNLVVVSAIGVSMDFIFPMGTPPSALAYGTGYIRVKDLIKSGVLLSIAGAVLLAIFAFLGWPVI
ncbi:MAG: DASS family sodium-coupled anion symporter [Candidatus Micrarchaeota archaeon]